MLAIARVRKMGKKAAMEALLGLKNVKLRSTSGAPPSGFSATA